MFGFRRRADSRASAKKADGDYGFPFGSGIRGSALEASSQVANIYSDGFHGDPSLRNTTAIAVFGDSVAAKHRHKHLLAVSLETFSRSASFQRSKLRTMDV